MRVIWLAVVLALSLAFAPLATEAQQPGSADARAFKPEELEQIVAPIVQYPDPLLAQIFMACTYPLEVIQAARFAKAHRSLKGDALNEELKKHTWDDSVKVLVSFPQVLEMMDSQLEWMQKLADAVLSQQKDTMDAVRRLRAKAPQPPQSYWYYCPSAGAYYPTAPSCPEPWIKVPPRAQ
ncbi:MAG: DUF3300 domain-containing protein [Candidatus Rokuibacteriota bacterium]